jgi:hypothetical protein
MSLLSESASSSAPPHSNHPPHRNAASNVIPQYDNPSLISLNHGHNPNYINDDAGDYYEDSYVKRD